ncbi:YshB family small membrane protein [Intestinirhabdus alba]|jgi:hypothetical protein|uniref:YshB family small membrane protein n=1 Tax=Intestinirhabdus alba TaxID=2899544 RepID=A0A6L6IMW1_9ENTR|nr:YshB family small membrane protein [Intestinirhabdus alba]MTH47028.1 YshB family small membrane protein [Intestinirhabdus alba]
MLATLIHLLASGTVDGHTPQTTVAAVLCAALAGLFSQAG